MQGTKLQFKMAELWFKIFRVDRIEVRGPIHGVEVQLGMGEFITELGMLIQNSDYYKDKMLLMQAQENGGIRCKATIVSSGGQDNTIDEDVDEQPVQDLALNVDNVFQADDYPVNNKAGPSYDSDILSEVQDPDHYQDVVCSHHEEHVMHDNVKLNHVVESHADYTSNNNMIPYDHFVKDNTVPIVHSNVSSVPNDAYMMIYNDMYEPHAQSVSKTSRNTVVENSLIAEHASYKEQVELYERRARNNREAHLDYLRHLKESVETIRKIVEEAKVVRTLDSPIVSACRYTKHSQELLEYAIGTCLQDSHQQDKKLAPAPLIRKKTIRFGNDHFGAIMGYGDYVIGDSVISMVYYVEGLGHNLFFVGQFYDSDLEVAFRKHSCYV
nr:integrase, catalytic region, zinc finger, CCHC-type, peptidase aspartic, catalytic [Tanacetum cinerariifolium]